MSNQKLGISDFLDFMAQGQPEWGILALKTRDNRALENLGEALGRPNRTDEAPLVKHEDLMLSVQESDPEAFDRAAAMVAVLRVKDSDWLLVFHSIGSYSAELNELAQSLSKKLNTRCIAFSAEDTSAATGYSIYESGERRETAALGDTFTFESKERAKPDLQRDDEAGNAFLEEVFKQNGIYLPACHPLIADGKVAIGVQGIEPQIISEAYLFED